MKRNDDGYVLPLVMVVLLVLGIVVTSVMSAALQNIKMQNKVAERMQEKYVAEGLIEKVVATLLDEKSYLGTESREEAGGSADTGTEPSTPTTPETEPDTDPENPDEEPEEGTVEPPDEKMCLAIQGKINELCGDHLIDGADNEWKAQKLEDKDIFEYTIHLEASHGSRTITCKVKLSGSMKAVEKTVDGETKTTYEAKELSIKYKEYQIGGAEE